MIHIPRAHQAFNADGVAQDKERWSKYGERTWAQLEWWGAAAAGHRQTVDPFATSTAFLSDPSQRNAP